MNLQNEIKDFVISFFTTIHARFTHDDGVYNIAIPTKYVDYFHASNIVLTFDKEASKTHNCELIIPGSATLGTIIRICSRSGAISLKKSDTSIGKIVLRYHFFIDFSGMFHASRLMYVDVDLNTCTSTQVSPVLERAEFSLDDFNTKNITPSYIAATEVLKDECQDMERKFVDAANKKFAKDFELFITKFDSQIRDLDNSIHEKEQSVDGDESNSFMFDTLEKISHVENEKARLIETLQKKHMLSLEYRLVACEIIMI